MGFDKTRKQPRLSKEYVYEKLRDSLIINSKEEIETKGLEQLIRTTDNPNDATELVKKLGLFADLQVSSFIKRGSNVHVFP